MDTLFVLSCMFLVGCFIFRKKLGMLLHGRKRVQELPMGEDVPGKGKTETYKVLVFNARDYKDTKELENAMELRLEQCLAGLARQGSRYEVSFHGAGYEMVYLVKYWY